MNTYIFLQHYWWFVVSLLGALLVFLLFVQGGNSLLFCLGKTEEQKKMMINSTGRKWEFTFTTLVTFGGAFFASFPLFYSTSFGGAYWLWMIILFSFVLQAVSYEFQSKAGNLLGKTTYRTFLVINGVVGPVLLGGAVATFFTGSNFYINKGNIADAAMPVISQWANGWHGLDALLNPWNVVLGLAVFFLARILGALYFINNINEDDLVKRCRRALWGNTALFLVFFLAFVIRTLLADGYAVNPETKEMILKVIAESNYVPNNSARNLKRSNAKAIAILVKGMDNMFFNNMISVIEEVVRKKKYACIIERVEEKANEVDSAIEIVKEKRLRGIIFLGGNFTHPHEKMAQIPVPYVISTIGAVSDGGKPCASVSVDDYRESYKMVDYLCGLGHRRIAIITACEDDISIGRLRLNAYRQALLDHGIPYDPDLVFHMTKDDTYSFATGYKVTKEILEKKTEFSALYATADTLAIGACRALKEAGLTVPDDISVAGFDGIDAGEYYIPSITTIRQPVEQLAAETAKMLFSLISGKEEPCSKVYDGELVVRESTKSRIAQQ